jgi:hypothetical protein
MLICVCLRILASSRIPRYDLGRQNPSSLRWFCHTCQCWTPGRRPTSHHWLSLLIGGHHHVCSYSHLRVPSRTGSTVVCSPSGEHHLSMSGPTTALLLLRLIAVGRVAPLLALALCMFFGRGEQEWGLGFPEGATTHGFVCSICMLVHSMEMNDWCHFGLNPA